MKRRIVIIGGNLNYNLEQFICNAFENIGHEVKFIGYKNILGRKYRESIRMLATRSHAFRYFSSPFWLEKLNEIYYKNISEYNPDFVLSLKGETISNQTLKKIKLDLGIKTALWYPDDPRFFASLVKYIAPSYDMVFTYSENATKIYNSIGVHSAKRVPFGCDPKLHYNNFKNIVKENRAIFIGTYSPKRYRFIKSLIKRNVPIDIAGPYWPPGTAKYVINKGVYGEQYVELLKKYSVVLNLHQDINYGPNMRTFEVTGSGGLLLTDQAEDILSFFSNGKEILTYNDIDDAQLIIKNILNGSINTEKIIRKAYATCHSKYSYEIRANEIVTNI